eukprot:CAMPEP_0172569792 /NCGR_PEP_ID=MMETSP1067-20121228/125015_1 /TAXON_ID=265564 ORGANISM="Thalassiosira punctigera, Strain Tpunct2005C2" /NCGR_SAMPLE_ID=MMETSP1067 /ASSEMBLY_ACC=CAM_ASM_000444 /LENGTH=35 /DNA_ID= /DNA_START= /DNA_END= /DNA_ORIENTATION=
MPSPVIMASPKSAPSPLVGIPSAAMGRGVADLLRS